MAEIFTKKNLIIAIKVILVLALIAASIFGFLGAFLMFLFGFSPIYVISVLLIPMLIPLVVMEKRKLYGIIYGCVALVLVGSIAVHQIYLFYKHSITIDMAPTINVNEYLPFDENSKIVKLRSEKLQFTDEKSLPRVDGAAAAFPVYSAFVNATYPEGTKLGDGAFQYNNTVGGYKKLARRDIDVFFGAYPSKEQIEEADFYGTTFEYTQIASEAFVFFVNKSNPIESLTAQQIKDIYSGKITNWREVGGKNEEIVAFQRNEGSGSQSMMLRFMGDTPIMPAQMKVSQGMGGIIEEVADYENSKGAIGFSFRFYVEGMIKNPDIKMIAIDGIAPTVENVKNGSYPIVAPVYAVTYEGNDNPNVARLVEWVLSDEGQYIIEQTGYVGIK
jgi:phosphate transport system substrate-binding protein